MVNKESINETTGWMVIHAIDPLKLMISSLLRWSN